MTAEAMEEERKKAEAEQKRRMDQQYQKLVAYLWRMEQEAAKVASETADDYLARLLRKQKSLSSNGSKNGQLMAEQRQQRDREWLEHRRRQLLTRQQQQPSSKVAPLRRAVSVPRDPQRLLRPTSAFMARLLPATDDGVSGRPTDSYILNVQSKWVVIVFLVFLDSFSFMFRVRCHFRLTKDNRQLFDQRESLRLSKPMGELALGYSHANQL